MKDDDQTTRRRSWESHLLETKGEFTMEDLVEKAKDSLIEGGGFTTGYESIRKDIAFLETFHRIKIRRDQRGKSIAYVNQSQPTSMKSAKVARTELNAAGKLGMAGVAGTVVLGSGTGGRFTIGNAEIPANRWKQILEEPRYIQGLLDEKYSKLRSDLEAFWNQSSRRICLDTGTSMDALSDHVLQHVSLPSEDTILGHMEICTNSRPIFFNLGRPEVDSRVIVLGGSQESRTECLCGDLAEMFLENLGLNIGISFIGATVIDMKEGHIGADTQRIARMKAKMLDLARIKIVVADSTKFTHQPLRAYYPAVNLSKDTVHAIITDRNIGNSTNEDDLRTWKRLRELGIPILCPSERVGKLAGIGGPE